MFHRSLVGVLAFALASAAAALPARAADTFNIDPVHSSVIFGISHFDVGNFWGTFIGPGGTFVLDGENPENSSFNVVVKAESVATGNDKRDQHLKSGDFFNVKQFPEITFKSTSVKQSGDDLEVAGELTLLGVTKPLTLTLKKIGEGDTRAGYRAGFQAEFTIKRSDFGMNFMQGAGGLGDEVRMIVAFEGVRQ